MSHDESKQTDVQEAEGEVVDLHPDGQEPADADPPGEPVDGAALVEEAEPAYVVELRAQVEHLQARLRTVSAAYKDKQDEIAAVRARLERQAAVDGERRRGEVVATLFEPSQNLRRSLDAMKRAEVGEELVAGLEMVLHQFMEAFHRLGLEEVPGKGARFDPNLHEALATAPVTDPALDGIVLDVFSAGFRIGSRLITPARVIIGQLQESAGEA